MVSGAFVKGLVDKLEKDGKLQAMTPAELEQMIAQKWVQGEQESEEKAQQGDLMGTSKALEAPSTTIQERAETAPRLPPSRRDKAQITFWLDPEFKRSLLAVKMQDPSRSLEDIHAEALNDLFRKYGVPTVPATPEPQAAKPRGPKRSPG